MNVLGIFDSVRIDADVTACEHCGSTSRVGRGLCLNCLLERALSDIERKETLEAVLDAIDVRDSDWRIGNYQILEQIGRGGMGVIYRARQRHSRRIVALKRIAGFHADSPETLARFRREAEAAASLDHPNILPIYEVSETADGLPFFSMKFAAGGSLLDAALALRNEPNRSVALMAKVARAVHHAHLKGILHRDLKPGNILLDGRGEPLVSDFGLAKWLEASNDLTQTLTIFGTPGYIAPEQAKRSAAKLTPAADVYSLGAILFDLFTGRTPFLGEHALAVIEQASDKPAPKLRSLLPGFDRDLETICAKCLEREPQARYRSAGDLAEDLERCLEGRPIIARPVSPTTRAWRWSKRNPKLAGSFAVCVLLGCVAGAFQIQNRIGVRAEAMAMHSVAVEPLLDLDTAQPDSRLSSEIARALQKELSKHGPVRVTPISDNARIIATSGSNDEDAKSRWQGARTALQGTRRIRDGKLRVSLRLLNAADTKVIYKKIIDAGEPDHASDVLARLTADHLFAILDLRDLAPAEVVETDPGWRDETTRELLTAGRAVQERRTLVDMARAVELFEKATKAQPKSALAHSYLAEAQFARAFFTGDVTYLSAAAQAAKDALRLDSKIAEAHKSMSEVLFQQGRFRESLEEGFAAYELLDSDDGRLPTTIGFNLRMLGEPATAVAWYRISKSSRPGASDLWGVADCLADLADDENAAAEYRRVSVLFPELPEGWIGLCRLAMLRRDFATARKIATENWTRYRDYVFSEEMAAQVEFFSRNFTEAEKLYEELAARDPNGGEAFYGGVSYQSALGRLRRERHDEQNGSRILNVALARELQNLQSSSKHPGILYRIAAIKASLGDIESAVDFLKAASEAGWIDYRSAVIDPRFDSISKHPEFQAIIRATEAKIRRQRENRLPSGNQSS
jgi:serine/threonine protein kinase/Tfp pilus assembly protein PilF